MPFKFDQTNKKESVMYTLRNLPPNTTIFFRAYDYVEKADLKVARAVRIQKENWG